MSTATDQTAINLSDQEKTIIAQYRAVQEKARITGIPPAAAHDAVTRTLNSTGQSLSQINLQYLLTLTMTKETVDGITQEAQRRNIKAEDLISLMVVEGSKDFKKYGYQRSKALCYLHSKALRLNYEYGAPLGTYGSLAKEAGVTESALRKAAKELITAKILKYQDGLLYRA